MRHPGLLSAAILILLSAAAFADEPAPMGGQGITDLVRGKTVGCIKEKDQALCSNFFAAQGIVTRIMHADGARKVGRWFVDDQPRLCILWDGKIKPLCFSVFEQPDGSYKLIRKGKHITTITGTEDGNSKGL